MKKIIVGFVLGLFLSLGAVGLVAHAKDISLSDFVERLLTLGIIAPDKAEQARLAAKYPNNDQFNPFCYNFKNNLGVGNKKDDVLALRKALVREGVLTSDNNSERYDEALAAAVVAFQEKYRTEILTPSGLVRGNGFIGVGTRAYLNRIYGCQASVRITPNTLPKATVGESYKKKISLEPASLVGGVVMWRVASGTLPSGLSITAQSNICVDSTDRKEDSCADKRSALIYGVPSVAGTFTFTINASVSNQAGTATTTGSSSYIMVVSAGKNNDEHNGGLSISGLTAPTRLKVGEVGTWTVNASDTVAGSLNYSVVWGDEVVPAPGVSASAPQFVQSATFTHAYIATSTYKPTFVVKNGAGLMVRTSASVRVGEEVSNEKATLKVTVLNGGIVCITTPCEFPLKGAVVVISSNDGRNIGKRETAGDNGKVSIDGLAPGRYNFYVIANGYKDIFELGITLQAGDNMKTVTMFRVATQ